MKTTMIIVGLVAIAAINLALASQARERTLGAARPAAVLLSAHGQYRVAGAAAEAVMVQPRRPASLVNITPPGACGISANAGEQNQGQGERVGRPIACPVSLVYEITAYCACEICCKPKVRKGRVAKRPWRSGITASGKPVTANGGKFCAAPRSIPFGTMIDIPGYGRVPVLDRGGAIKTGKLDVYFPTHKAALQWGRQKLMVTIYE